ncbi:MAG TPA: LysR family transcriptional regulator [Telluria sp.]|jgi:DNA-binding transcriptional LysR family regulator
MRPNEFAELSAFVAVAEEKSFRRAAERLSLTPSTLSHSLRALEERLGVRLLNRTTRSVSATDAGVALLAEIGPALRRIDSALGQVNVFSDRPRGTVRVNLPHLAAEMVLGARLGEFARAYPDVVLDLAADDRFLDIVGQGYDAGIRLGESLDQDMVATRVTPELRIVVVGSPAYVDAHPAPLLSPDDLRQHRCIGYRANASRVLCKWEFDNGARTAAVLPAGPLIVDSHVLLVRAALDGVGLAYVVESAVADALAAGRLVRVLDDWCQPFPGFFLYYPSRRQLSSALRALIDFVRV